jgi:hypothetical protein
MWYRILDNKIYDYADWKYLNECKYTDVITTQEYDVDKDKIIVVNGEVCLNPEYQDILNKREKDRISKLKCTKRVFVLMLEKMGLDYFEQIEPLINNNRQAKLEWELCVELERSNELLDILATELGVTPRQLDLLFQYANGEDVKLEVVNG